MSLSVLASTVPGMSWGIHPWRRLRALAHITLVWHDDGPMGETDFEAGVISLRRGMSQAERRSTILHECLHVERGPVPMGLADKEEERVCRHTAQELLPDVRAIADALAWARWNLVEAAEELWVDVDTLACRLATMTHPAERAYMRQRFEED